MQKIIVGASVIFSFIVGASLMSLIISMNASTINRSLPLPSIAVPVPTQSMASIAVPAQRFGGTDTPPDNTQLQQVPVDCPDSNITDLYDTPSGNMDVGYYDASGKVPDMSTTTYRAANKIGKQAYTLCSDPKGNKFIIPLTIQEYNALALPNAGTPQKTVLEEVTK